VTNGNSSGFVIALALATAGICLSAYTVEKVADSNRIHESRMKTLKELAALRGRVEADRSGMRLLETIPGGPVDPAGAAVRVIPGTTPVFGDAKDRELPGGWTLREVSVTISDTPPSEAGRLVEYLENQQPPWRLTAFEYSGSTSDRGITKLDLQTIVRKAAP